MGAPWNLSEARLVQTRTTASAANAIYVSGPPCPTGKVWCVFGVMYYPSAAETKTISFEKVTGNGTSLALMNPIELNLNPSGATPIEQGMEIFLLPGEYIMARRDSATAGSTMTIVSQFVEIDLPLYTYDEPQVVKRQDRAISSIRQRLGGGTPASVRGRTDLGRDLGGRTGPLPK